MVPNHSARTRNNLRSSAGRAPAGNSSTVTTVEKIHSFLWVILVTSRSIRFSEKCLEMLRNERFSAGLIALQR